MSLIIKTDYDAIRQALITWLQTYSGAGMGDVTFKNQSEYRPSKPYGSILVISDGIRFGFDGVVQDFEPTNQVVQRTYYGPRQMTIQAEIYTDTSTAQGQMNAVDRLNYAVLSLETMQVQDIFRAANMAYISHTSVNDLAEQLGERWESRAQADLKFLYTGEIFDDGAGSSGDWVETVQVPTESNGNLIINE